MGAMADTFAHTVRSELELVEELAKKYDHHYYAWNHWAWLERSVRQDPEDESGVCGTGGPLGGSFPRLAHVTPSHYGLFHHRVVRLFNHLLHGVRGCDDAPRGALGLAVDALGAYKDELRLASSLLATFPYLEAPWAFRMQLFAAVIEAAVSSMPPAGPPT